VLEDFVLALDELIEDPDTSPLSFVPMSLL